MKYPIARGGWGQEVSPRCPHPLHLHFGASSEQRAQGRSPHPGDAQNRGLWSGISPLAPPPILLFLPAMGLQHWVSMGGGRGGLGPPLQPQGCRKWGGLLHCMPPPGAGGKGGGGAYGEIERTPPLGIRVGEALRV